MTPEGVPQPLRGSVGVFGQQQHRFAARRRVDIGLIDARIGEYEAKPVLDDQHVGSRHAPPARTPTGSPRLGGGPCPLRPRVFARVHPVERSPDRASGLPPWTRFSGPPPGHRRRRGCNRRPRRRAQSTRPDQLHAARAECWEWRGRLAIAPPSPAAVAPLRPPWCRVLIHCGSILALRGGPGLS